MSAGPLLLLCYRRPCIAFRLQTSTSQSSTNSLNISSSLCLSHCLYSFFPQVLFPPPHLFDSAFFLHFLLRFYQLPYLLYIVLHISPSLTPLSLFNSPQKRVWFITFLMLFVIAWHSQHVKSKSFFQSVCLCLVCRDLNQPSVSVALNLCFIHADREHLESLELKGPLMQDVGLQLEIIFRSDENSIFYLWILSVVDIFKCCVPAVLYVMLYVRTVESILCTPAY